MGEQMKFPNNFKEFAEQYKTVDTKEVYSNGIEYIPIFRVEQWLEYISAVEMATFKSVIDSLEQQLKTAKAEAVEEFAEKLKEEWNLKTEYANNIVFADDIDNLVKKWRQKE